VYKRQIEALIMAPNASLIPIPYQNTASYTGDSVHRNLTINFRGTMILNNISEVPPNNMATVFAAVDYLNRPLRVYAYDESFRDYPPPDLPAIAQTYYLLEENISSADLYD